MKRLSLLAVLCLTMLSFSACKNPEQGALVAVTAANTTADTAVGAFDDYRQSNPVPPATVAKVSTLALKYQAAKNVASDAAQGYKALANPATKSKLDASTAALASIETDLISLIRSINPNILK